MSTEFMFNPISVEEVVKYVATSKVFNNVKESIEREKISLASFSDEAFGAAKEKLDVAVFHDGRWKVLEIDGLIEGFNEIPLGYVVGALEYDKVLIILRRMSTMMFDKNKEGISTYMYNVIEMKYKGLEENIALYGILAKNGMCFTDLESLERDVEKVSSERDKKVITDWVERVRGGEFI